MKTTGKESKEAIQYSTSTDAIATKRKTPLYARQHYLAWYDIGIVTVIMFFWGIYSSTVQYSGIVRQTVSVLETTDFTPSDNYRALVMQGIFLIITFLYLRMRRFDFSRWTITVSASGYGYGILLFLVEALCMDAYTFLTAGIADRLPLPSVYDCITQFDFSVVIYALLNGFYEEIYFLGICPSVKDESLKWTIPFSLIVRWSFHTYQGMTISLGLGFVLGLLLYGVYKRSKTKNLFPFFVAHTIADIAGLTIAYYVFSH
ncbi:MAG: CPBP family intramembrane metalloprotease [Treponema sp.]|nr:CPBP family intramembrane metalloprotease [Treponema sp.]